MATVALQARRGVLSPGDRRTLGWISLGAFLGVGALGIAGDAPVLIIAGAAGTAALVAVLAPQVVLAVFLLAGVTKSTPALSGLPVDLTVVAAGGVVLAMGRRAMRPGGLPPLPLATGFGAALAALVLLSVLWTPGADVGLERAIRFQTLTMVAFTAPLVLIRSRSDLMQLAVTVAVVAAVVALTAVETGHASEPLVAAGGGDEITLALYTASGLLASVAYLALADRPWRRPLWLALAAIVFVPTILAAGSRGVLTGTVVSLAVLGGFVIARSRHKPAAVGAILVAVIAFVSVAPLLAGDATAKYNRLLTGRTEAAGARSQLYSESFDLALAHPMGMGVGAFQAETGVVYPHNALLEAAVEEGVLGLVLLLAIIVAAARAAPRAPAGAKSPESIFAVTFLILLVTEAMFSETFTQNRVFWFALGLALAAPRIVSTNGPAARQ